MSLPAALHSLFSPATPPDGTKKQKSFAAQLKKRRNHLNGNCALNFFVERSGALQPAQIFIGAFLTT